MVLQCIPAHCGIPGNERADHLAKSGSKQLQPLSTSTYQEAKTLLRNRQKCQWKKATGDYNPSTDPINRLARHEQTAIFRLRTGHCGLRAHLKRTGIMDSALCDCKEAEQTVHHILQDCPIWRKQRHQLWQQNRRSTTSSRTVSSGGNRDTSYGSRTDDPPHPPGLSHPAETETPVMAAEQTVHHILQDCLIRRKQRHQLWQQNRRSTTSSRTVSSGGNRDTSYGSRTDGPPHPPGLSHLAETETPVMAAGLANRQQAVGNGKDLRRTTQFLTTCGLRV